MKKLKRKDMNSRGIILYIFISVGYILFIMILYGMAEIYYPDPIEFASGWYIDIRIGIVLFGTMIFFLITGIFSYYYIKNRR